MLGILGVGVLKVAISHVCVEGVVFVVFFTVVDVGVRAVFLLAFTVIIC